MGKNKGKKGGNKNNASFNDDNDEDVIDATGGAANGFHWQETKEAMSSDVANALALFTSRVQSHIDSAYHGVLGEQLRYICEQAATLDSPQAAALFAYLSSHACAIEMKENWDKVAPNVHAVGFKIGLRKGRRAPDDKLYLQNPDLQENLPRGIIFTRRSDAARRSRALLESQVLRPRPRRRRRHRHLLARAARRSLQALHRL
jgi:hypothetical protein